MGWEWSWRVEVEAEVDGGGWSVAEGSWEGRGWTWSVWLLIETEAGKEGGQLECEMRDKSEKGRVVTRRKGKRKQLTFVRTSEGDDDDEEERTEGL